MCIKAPVPGTRSLFQNFCFPFYIKGGSIHPRPQRKKMKEMNGNEMKEMKGNEKNAGNSIEKCSDF